MSTWRPPCDLPDEPEMPVPPVPFEPLETASMTVLGHAQSAATYLDVARIWHDHAFEAGYAIEARDRKKLDQLLAELSANADILRLKILRS